LQRFRVACDSWYKSGLAVLLFERAIVVAVSTDSLHVTFHGFGGFPGETLNDEQLPLEPY
jgi:hypothetical protein